MPNPVTVVTGGSRGIGRSIVSRLAADGHYVISLSRSAPPEDIPAQSYSVDLSDLDATAKVIDEIVERHDVDHLVNNAAAIEVDPIEDIRFSDFQKLVDVNLRATLKCIQAVVPRMREKQRGRIVNIGSRAALGKAERTIYSMTKAGIVGLSRSLALELAQYGITVNVVSPGPIETEMFWANSDPNDPSVQALINAVPVGRMGRPCDVAAAVAFFLREDASFVTGQTLHVCGGLSIATAAL